MPSNASDFVSFPLEIFEMIVGALSFVDLPHFLQTSKAINSYFQGTRYYEKLSSIHPEDLSELYRLLSKFPKSWLHWSTDVILTTFTDRYCHHCRDFGSFYIWCSVPPLKLCGFCIPLPQYHFIRLQDALTRYGWRRSEVATFPTLKSLKSNYPKSTTIIHRYMLMPHSEKLEGAQILNLDTYVPADNNTHWTRGNCGITGTMKISRTFDKATGRWLGEFICAHCIKFNLRQNLFDRCSTRLIPRSYDCLREHIANQHNDLLDYFEKGWETLSMRLKAIFLDMDNPSMGRTPAAPQAIPIHGFPITGRPIQMMQMHMLQLQAQQSMLRGQNRLSPFIWTSWAEFAYSNIQVTPWSSVEAIALIASQMEHDGSVFGLPPFPENLQRQNNQLLGGVHLQNMSVKDSIASILLTTYMERVKAEAWKKLKRRIEENGVNALQTILNDDTIFE